MAIYDLEARTPLSDESPVADKSLSESMWNLFIAIGKFWGGEKDFSYMKSNFLVFLANRIEFDRNYLNEYKNADEVIRELIAEQGESEGYKKLLTDAAAGISSPPTRLSRARQLVSNEFIQLFLALGGFREFTDAKNFPGYFGGANLPGRVPYRTSTD